MKTIKQGSRGEEVRRVQQLLRVKPDDGVFGPGTDAAVKAWQRACGLEADGIVGSASWLRLLTDSIGTKHKHLSAHITRTSNRRIEYLAIHYTAGSNSRQGRALGAYDTFMKGGASADYCVDDKDIVQLTPDPRSCYCWAVGDKRYQNHGGKLYGKATNRNTLSIEVCSTCQPATSQAVRYANHSGWKFTDAALANAVRLAKVLMQVYDIPLDHVVRHYDISGKLCPGIVGWNDEPVCDINGKSTGTMSTSHEWQRFLEMLK